MNFSNLMRPGPLIVLIVVLVLLFGAKRLPDAARSLGRSLRIIKAETRGLVDDGKTDDLAEKADAQAGRQPLSKEQDSDAATGEILDPPRRVRDNQ
jgi:sec-independent protein translocase protein TatA